MAIAMAVLHDSGAFLRSGLPTLRVGMSRVIIILGMHRSGTSCLTGCLQEAELFLGQVNEVSTDNLKGNRENRAIMNLHDDLLAANGGSWDCPPSTVVWSPAHEGRREALIAGYPKDRIWGFKDPRTLLTLEGWLEALPSTRCVGTFRHPWAVASSLNRRNRMPFDQGLNLWAVYNRRLLHHKRAMGFDLINFDLRPEDYLARLDVVAGRLDLKTANSAACIFDPTLRVSVGSDQTLPGEIKSLYAELREASV
jgi:hypothetical protein